MFKFISSTKVLKSQRETLFKRLKEIEKKYVTVGIHENKKYEDNTPVAMIAAIHEFGSDNVPERSFIRSSINENKSTIKKYIRLYLQQVLRLSMSVDTALASIGNVVAAKHKEKIVKGEFTPLSKVYYELKMKKLGKAYILRYTDTLLQSIDYEIKTE
jgi:hypothetical protein